MAQKSQEFEISMTIQASPARLFNAFTTAEGWCEWCCEKAECEGSVGGKLHIYTEGYNAYGEFQEYEQDRAISFTWDGDGEPLVLIEVLIDQENEKSHLSFKVIGLCSDQEWAGIAEFLERTWGRVLNNLKTVVESCKVIPVAL
jgi:uncharacterized protein YndB with AHSA1/START domain